MASSLVQYSDDSSSSEGEENGGKCADVERKESGSKRKANDDETHDVLVKKPLKAEAPKVQ